MVWRGIGHTASNFDSYISSNEKSYSDSVNKRSLIECLQPLCRNSENRLVFLKLLNLMLKTRHNVKSGNLDFIPCVLSPCPGKGQESNNPDQWV